MTTNLQECPSVGADLGQMSPNWLNTTLLLEITQILCHHKTTLFPLKRSGFPYEVFVLYQACVEQSQLKPKEVGNAINYVCLEKKIPFQSFTKETFSNEKKRRYFPDQPSLSRCIKELREKDCIEAFWNDVLLAHLLLLKERGLIKKEVKLIADYHEEPCKKDVDDIYCFGTKEGHTVHKTLTFSIISNDIHQIIANFKIAKRVHKLPFFEKIIQLLNSNGFYVVYALLDRGFYRKEILQAFNTRKITLIMPGRKCKQTLLKILKYLLGKGNRRCKGFIPLKYVKKVGYPKLSFDLLLVAKRSYKLNEILADLETNKLRIADAVKRIFPLIVGLWGDLGISTLLGNERYIRDLYRQRWQIEIAFREMNRFGISKHVQDRDARLSITGAKSLLYNIWQVQRYLLQKENPASEPLELNEFIGRTRIHRYVQYILPVC